MDIIETTFPKFISKDIIIHLLENNLKKNTSFTCKVEFIKEYNDTENLFKIISSSGAEAFYLIGMIASGIIDAYLEISNS